MEHITYEQAVEVVQSLLPEDRQRLQDWLAEESPQNGQATNSRQIGASLQ